MRVLRYTIKSSLAKLNIKHRMSCNKPIAYKMLIKFFQDIFCIVVWEGGNSHICLGCAIFRPLRNIKILGSIFSW